MRERGSEGTGILISVVSPVYACATCLEALAERVRSALECMDVAYELILVCDGSPDDAWARMKDLAGRDSAVRAINLSRNFGQHAAISAGLEQARGDYIVVMDCDLQDQPEEIPKLFAKAQEGYEVVFGRRVDRKDSWFKRLGSRAFFTLLSSLTGVTQDAASANFGVFSRRVIVTVNRMPESVRCFPLMVKWTGFPAAYVDIDHARRAEGKSSYTLSKLIRLALNVVLSYSDKPLRMVVKFGLWFSLAAFVFALISVYRYFAGDIAVAGFTSIIASIWLIGGVVVCCVGVVGLYVARIFNESQGRPYYVLDQIVSGKMVHVPGAQADSQSGAE